MRTNHSPLRSALKAICLGLCVAGLPVQASAQTLYMDVNGATAGFGNYAAETYQWSTALDGPQIWTSDAAGTAATSSYTTLGGASHVVFDRGNASTTTADHTVVLQQSLSLGTIEVKGSRAMTLSGAAPGTLLTVSMIDTSTVSANFVVGANLELRGPLTISAGSGRYFNLNSRYSGSGITLNGGILTGTNGDIAVHMTSANAYVQSNSGSVSVGSISGSGNLLTYYANSGSKVVVNQTSGGIFSGNIRKGASGSNVMGFEKRGDAMLTLTGTSTFDGATSITAGELRINTVLTNTTGVTVASGASISGTGETTGVTVLSGGRLGGNSFIDSLETMGLTLEAGAIFAAEFNIANATTVASDRWEIQGGLSLASGNAVTLTLANLGADITLDHGTVFTLASYTTGRTGGGFTYDGAALVEGDLILLGSNSFRFSYGNAVGASAITLTAMAIPEASTFSLLLASCLIPLGYRRFRQSRVGRLNA